jgi:sterol desaturase/sphingolipid hydroxylase (fatty acid hydroxylase superfamily)
MIHANALWLIPLVFVALIVRYALISGGAYWLFWVRLKNGLASRSLQARAPSRSALRGEIAWSLATFVVFALAATLIQRLVLAGQTRAYFEVAERGWGYFAVTVVLLIVGHDTYFYFAHRFMHHPWVYRHVHAVHHRSTNPTPLAAFAFHPLEAVIEMSYVLGALLVLPLHPGALAIFIVFSHLMNAMGHLGYEIFPPGHAERAPWRWINSSTQHNWHHRRFRSNYGLYFTFWDRLMGTEELPAGSSSLDRHVVEAARADVLERPTLDAAH